MNVLSLFDGISCGQLALQRANIAVDTYYASEIDKYAIQITQKNFPNTIQLGNVVDICTTKEKQLPQIDLLMGGSPCQGFSASGKGLNFDDPRSKLFFEYIRLLKTLKPKWFLLENVVMKQEWQDIISSYMGCQPILIDSALFSAQMRKRLYWTNIPIETLPDGKNAPILQDVLESEVKKKYWTGGFNTHLDMHRMNPAAVRGRYLNKATIVGRRLDEKGHRQDYNSSIPITQCLEVRKVNPDKSNCLTTVTKDNVVTSLPCGRYPDVFNGNYSFRILTPVEYERLQTLPDNYTQGISNNQRYKCLGNGWTVDVIAHILKGIVYEKEKTYSC